MYYELKYIYILITYYQISLKYAYIYVIILPVKYTLYFRYIN